MKTKLRINEYLDSKGVEYEEGKYGTYFFKHESCSNSKGSSEVGRIQLLANFRTYYCSGCEETGTVEELLSKCFDDNETYVVVPRYKLQDTLKPIEAKKEHEKEEVQEKPDTFSNMSISELKEILDQTILYDNANKCILFLGFLTAYTEQDQLNIYLSGPSSSGKTYLAKEVAKYFPKEDCEEISGASPKAFFYRKPKVDEESGMRYIDAERKIYLFLEIPHFQLMENLRGFLSHDSKNSLFLRTNKDNKSKNVAEETYLRGFSATVFCTASMNMDEQEATRALLLSPEVSQEKLEASVKLANDRNANPEKFERTIESDPKRESLKHRIEAIRELHINSVILPDPEAIHTMFRDITKSIKPRHTRDIVHLQSLIKAVALLNAWSRLDAENNVIANEDDVEQAVQLWKDISTSQELGIPPYAYNFWESFIVPSFEDKNADKNDTSRFVGVTRQEVANKYYQLTQQMVNEEGMRKRLYPTLISAGLIREEQNQYNKRQILIYPIYPNKTIPDDIVGATRR